MGQQIQLGAVSQTLCAGATVPISFSVNGSFGTGNTFRIEILTQFDQLVATATDNVLASGAFIRTPPTLTPNPVEYQIRIVATSPNVVSNTVPLKVNSLPSATLLPPFTTDVSLNPGEPLNVPIALVGGGPYSLSFTDGTTRSLDDVSQATLLLYPEQTKTYQLASVTNQCGTGRGNGTASATVRSAGLLVTRLSTTELCAGKPLDIYFSTDRPLPPNTTFKVDLHPLSPQAAAYTIQATGNTSPLRIQVPAAVATGGAYQLRLYSDGANVSAYYRNSLGDIATPVLLRRAPSVQLTGNATVGFGQVANLTATVTGLGNGAITLSDGTVVSLSTLNQDGDRMLPVKPAQTITYTVRAVSTSCGVYGADAGSGSAAVTVETGYRIDSLSSLSVCAGQPIQ
ncbi:MAG TPA: hypothetical protein VGB67_11000, partial [Fibrella sp.]